VLAVAFLSGVFVGRGVRIERAAAVADAGAVSPVTTPDLVASQETPPAAVGSDPTAAAPPPAVDELSYFNRLEKQGQPEEDLKPAAGKAAPAAAAARAEKPRDTPTQKAATVAPATPSSAPPASKASAAPAAPAPSADASLAEPSGPGFVLQISALNERAPAEVIAKRLSAKGYAAYVTSPAAGAPARMYRVRIGKFKTRREAEAIAAKVEKEEQIKPWITR